jgi:hypothetical protein
VDAQGTPGRKRHDLIGLSFLFLFVFYALSLY